MKHDIFYTKRYGKYFTVCILVLAGVMASVFLVRVHLLTNALLHDAEHTQVASPSVLR